MMNYKKEWRYRTGRSKKPNLTPEQVQEVIALYILGDKVSYIAEKFGLTEGGIYKILRTRNIKR